MLLAAASLIAACERKEPPPESRPADDRPARTAQPQQPAREKKSVVEDVAETPARYVAAVVGALEIGEIARAKTNLAQLYRALQQYAAMHGGAYPPSLEMLVDEGTAPRALILRTGDEQERPFGYVAGLSTSGEADAVLVYDERPVYDRREARALVLTAGGKVTTLPPDALAERLEAGGSR
jgi:hypothetical protein